MMKFFLLPFAFCCFLFAEPIVVVEFDAGINEYERVDTGAVNLYREQGFRFEVPPVAVGDVKHHFHQVGSPTSLRWHEGFEATTGVRNDVTMSRDDGRAFTLISVNETNLNFVNQSDIIVTTSTGEVGVIPAFNDGVIVFNFAPATSITFALQDSLGAPDSLGVISSLQAQAVSVPEPSAFLSILVMLGLCIYRRKK